MNQLKFTGEGLKPIDAEFSALVKDTCNNITKVHLSSIETAFRRAILKAEGGVMPDEATLRERGQIVIDREGVHHLLWKAPKTVIGEKPDMTKCIASVCSPKLFNFSRQTP